MNICHICSYYSDAFFSNLIHKQIELNITLRVFYFHSYQEQLDRPLDWFVDSIPCHSQLDRLFFKIKEHKATKKFFDTYKENDFDLLHAHSLFSNGYIALQVKKNWNKPYIVAVRDTDVNLFFKKRFFLRKIGIEILKEAEKIIFLSSTYRDEVINRYVPNSLKKEFLNKSTIIPNGIDDFYLTHLYTKLNPHFKKTLNIVTVGIICKRKNQLFVCKALSKMFKAGYSVKYDIIGKIRNRRLYKKIIKYPFVQYHSFMSKENLINLYREADIFVMPSITETFGLTYAEAMSQGLPVIYTKSQGFDKQFDEGTVGYHCSCKDIDNLINKINCIINNYEDISKNCPILVNKFNWLDIAKEYKEIYKKII